MLSHRKLGPRLLAAFFLVAAFSAALTTVVAIYFFSERIEEDALNTLRIRTQMAKHAYQQQQQGLENSARFLSHTPTIRNFTLFASAPQLQEYLKTLVETEPFHQVVVYGKEQQPLAFAQQEGFAELATTVAWDLGMLVNRAYHDGEMQIATEMIYTEEGTRLAITAVAPILTTTLKPQVVGAILLRHLLDRNQSLMVSLLGFFEGDAALYYQGQRIAQSGEETPAQLCPATLAAIAAHPGLHQEARFRRDGQIATYQPLSISDSQEELILALFLPAKRYVETTHSAILQLLGVMLACILLALLLASLLTRTLLQPIRHLMQGVRALTSGNLEHEITTTRRDELGELALAFNSMASQLRDFFAVLRATVDTLTRVGTALSAEHSLDSLLHTVVHEARKVSYARQGAVYEIARGEFRLVAGDASAPPQVTPEMAEYPLFTLVSASQEVLHLDPHSPLSDERISQEPRLAEVTLLIAPLLDHQRQTVGLLLLRDPYDPKSGNHTPFSRSQLEIVRSLASQAAVAIENAKNFEKIENQNRVFARFVPTEFLSHLGRKELGEIELGDATEEKMVVMFSDIRAFTTLSEAMEPKEIFSFLNGYLRTIGPAISRNHGFIDKYIGDAVMALFSGRQHSPADEALQAVLEMRSALRQLNQLRTRAGFAPIEIGIGLHYGPLTLGTIGYKERIESTVLGDSVNLASRLESLTKLYGIQTAVTGEFVGMLQAAHNSIIREVDRVAVKGRNQSTLVFELLDPADSPPILAVPDALDAYHQALASYKEGAWKEADRRFSDLLRRVPDDPLTLWHHRRCREYRDAPPQQWNGITALQSK